MIFSLVTKRTPFTLETSDGDIELFFTEYTIADGERREKLISKIISDDSISDLEKVIRFQVARIMCSVKYDDGNYFFDGEINDVRSLIPEKMISVFEEQVSALNPLPLVNKPEDHETALDAKKKKS